MTSNLLQSLAASTSLIELVSHDWQRIDLPQLRTDLDEKLESIYEQTNKNKESRKDLSVTTRNFSKSSDAEKLQNLGSLLKSYQKHIDLETSRCKFIELSFLYVYQILSEAPDPIDALQNAQIKILEAQKTVIDYQDMKLKLNNYEKEFAQLKNQEITVRMLEEQLRLKDVQMDEQIKQALVEEKSNLEQKYNKMLNDSSIKNSELKIQIQSQQKETITLRQMLNDTQNKLFSENLQMQTTVNIENSTKSMLEEELERAQLKILMYEKEKQEWMEIKNEKESVVNSSLFYNTNEEMHFEIMTLKKRMKEILELNENLQLKYEEQYKINEQQVQTSDLQQKKFKQHLERFRTQMEQLPTEEEYHLLKKKLKILQNYFMNYNHSLQSPNQWSLARNSSTDISSFVELIMDQNIEQNIENENIEEENESSVELAVDTNIEILFFTKTRKLQSSINQLKLDLDSKNIELNVCRDKFSTVDKLCIEQKLLITKLETDLAQTVGGREVIGKRNKSSMVSPANSTSVLDDILNNDEKKVREEVIIDMEDDGSESGSEEERNYLQMPLPSSMVKKKEKRLQTILKTDSHSLKKEMKNSAFQIVCEQRDRFRAKVSKLEEVNIQQRTRIEKLTNDKIQLKQENVELFGKMKFLENYNHRQIVQSGSATNARLRNNTNMLSSHTQYKYERLYEETLNPFARFKQKEKQMRVQNLACAEWIAYVVGSTVLSKKLFRVFTVFYAIALHLLTFFTILHEMRTHGWSDPCMDMPEIAIQMESGLNGNGVVDAFLHG